MDRINEVKDIEYTCSSVKQRLNEGLEEMEYGIQSMNVRKWKAR